MRKNTKDIQRYAMSKDNVNWCNVVRNRDMIGPRQRANEETKTQKTGVVCVSKGLPSLLSLCSLSPLSLYMTVYGMYIGFLIRAGVL